MLMRQPERPDDADNPLRLAYAGPTPPEERHLEFERRFGVELTSGYAMSETPYGTVWRRGSRPYGTLGWPRQHPTLGEVNEARVNADGELELRNPAVMRGYWGMPKETEAVLAPDGWLKTGDLVTENPDGSYTMVGRSKEVIRRRGENVAPAEIEEALAAHPDVVEAAVIGVPSELSEEDIKAFVVLREGADADFDALREWASRRLTPFKVPSQYEALDELPHTPTGRVAKHRLPT
jgi:carnitine-CoA ligase